MTVRYFISVLKLLLALQAYDPSSCPTLTDCSGALIDVLTLDSLNTWLLLTILTVNVGSPEAVQFS